mmetsp:Transcript_1578/g.2294  ORF Transcript_1578/g.2294 Transcript_1578/m.2294 type:complete len:267 (-) Transcript_1578:651-1451(-)
MEAVKRARVRFRHSNAVPHAHDFIKFGQCLVDLIGIDGSNELKSKDFPSGSSGHAERPTPEAPVFIQESREKYETNDTHSSITLTVSQTPTNFQDPSPAQPYISSRMMLGHACDCPCQNPFAVLDERKQFTGLGVVCMLLCKDTNTILLTRRPKHMRSFPRAWVMPGGGVDGNDKTLRHAAARELFEETGFSVDPQQGKPIGMWESVYPTSRSSNKAITGHYLVIFFLFELESHTSETKQEILRFEDQEVDAAIWLPVKDIERLLR